MIEIFKPDFIHADERGKLVQLVHGGTYKQVNYVFSKASSKRGGHYHQINIEAFYVIRGSFNLVLQKGAQKEEYHFQTGDMFLIHPGVIHSFDYLEDTELIGFYDYGVELENGEKDIYSLEG